MAHLRLDLLLPLLDSEPAPRLVEVGVGMGSLTWHLAQGRELLGFEPDPKSFEFAMQRLHGMPNVELRNERLPPEAAGPFDALIALEVLEHIEDDLHALRSWTRWVRPGGRILISVPAKQARYGPMDRQVGHHRRYERDGIEALFLEAGLREVTVLSYGMPLGYLLDLVKNGLLAPRLSTAPDIESETLRSGRAFQPRRWSRLISVLMFPFCLAQRPFVRRHFGIGWIVVGRVT